MKISCQVKDDFEPSEFHFQELNWGINEKAKQLAVKAELKGFTQRSLQSLGEHMSHGYK